MRFWFSWPFIGRTRLGVSVSDRELLGEPSRQRGGKPDFEPRPGEKMPELWRRLPLGFKLKMLAQWWFGSFATVIATFGLSRLIAQVTKQEVPMQAVWWAAAAFLFWACLREWRLFQLIVLGLAAYFFFTIAAANAGTCQVYSSGGYSIEQCEDGSFTIWDRHGRKQQWGERNAGFNRYPAQPPRLAFPRRESDRNP